MRAGSTDSKKGAGWERRAKEGNTHGRSKSEGEDRLSPAAAPRHFIQKLHDSDFYEREREIGLGNKRLKRGKRGLGAQPKAATPQ